MLPLGIFSTWFVFHEDSHLKNASFVIGIFSELVVEDCS